jgi:4-diphosphocytidyl-2-C-methyl-D-erythritol kinase
MLKSEIAPAKINLTLEISGKRDDGYHNIFSLMQTIDLCDYLTFHKNPWLQIIPEYHNLPATDNLPGFDRNNYLVKNLVYKAAETLKIHTNYKSGAVIELKKSIPSSAGLGGGSSDAAAALRGLNRLWNLKLSDSELAEVGLKVGSDVPYFIYGGTCIISGRGEKIRKVKPILPKWILVILLPFDFKEKTKKLYSYVNSRNYTSGDITKNLEKKIKDEGCDNIRNDLFNAFEDIYAEFFEEYKIWIKKFSEIGIEKVHLAGSGPSVFYISSDEADVLEAAEKISNIANLQLYITRTVP